MSAELGMFFYYFDIWLKITLFIVTIWLIIYMRKE